jgi:hypothetical protein
MGLDRSTGDLLGYLNSDDVYTAGALAEVANASRKIGPAAIALLCGAVQDWDGATLSTIHRNAEFGTVHRWLDGGISLHQPGCFWTRTTWQRCGPFPVGCHYIFDRYFFTRCKMAPARMLSTPSILARFRVHKESKTSQGAIDIGLFAREWDGLKPDLEGLLPTGARFELHLRRSLADNLALNWRLASAALHDDTDDSARRRFWARLRSNPLTLLHRPVAAAAFRLAFKRKAPTPRQDHS